MGGYSEAFYVNDGGVTWLYYNPDSVAGGQYVVNELDFELIRSAAVLGDYDEFFSYLEERCRQYLVDVGTEAFSEYDEWFKSTPDIANLSEDSMRKLMSIAGK